MVTRFLLLTGLFAAASLAQLHVEKVFYPYTPFGKDDLPYPFARGGSDGFWPGGIVAIRCRGLKLPEPRIRISTYPLPTEYSGIRVMVGTGPGNEGLPAPLMELADLGDYQDIVVQVPWEYKRYTVEGESLIDGGTGATVFQAEESAEGQIGLRAWNIFFQDAEGYGLARNVTTRQWITERNPAQPGDILEVYMANMGTAYSQPGVVMPITGLPTPLPFSTLPDERGVLAADQFVSFGALFPGNTSRESRASWGFVGSNINETSGTFLVPGTVSRYAFRFRVPAVPPPGNGLKASYWYCPFGYLGLASVRCKFNIERSGQSDLVPIRIKMP